VLSTSARDDLSLSFVDSWLREKLAASARVLVILKSPLVLAHIEEDQGVDSKISRA